MSALLSLGSCSITMCSVRHSLSSSATSLLQSLALHYNEAWQLCNEFILADRIPSHTQSEYRLERIPDIQCLKEKTKKNLLRGKTLAAHRSQCKYLQLFVLATTFSFSRNILSKCMTINSRASSRENCHKCVSRGRG